MFQTALFLLAKTWEQRKCLSSSETAKTNRGHYDGLLLSNEKEWTIKTCNNIDQNQTNHDERKKPDKKKYILNNFICRKF